MIDKDLSLITNRNCHIYDFTTYVGGEVQVRRRKLLNSRIWTSNILQSKEKTAKDLNFLLPTLDYLYFELSEKDFHFDKYKDDLDDFDESQVYNDSKIQLATHLKNIIYIADSKVMVSSLLEGSLIQSLPDLVTYKWLVFTNLALKSKILSKEILLKLSKNPDWLRRVRKLTINLEGLKDNSLLKDIIKLLVHQKGLQAIKRLECTTKEQILDFFESEDTFPQMKNFQVTYTGKLSKILKMMLDHVQEKLGNSHFVLKYN
mmetsp:Transcript_26253/g.23234  ORF Transcript_26253/g.23234 Transcript_26253/m.23234 type:complete len:260 (-) Transcript_26253:14-793(-)